MSRRAQENLIAAILLLFFSGVIWLCQDFGPRARMIPYPLAIFGIMLTVIQIIWQNLRSTDELQMDMISVEPIGGGEEPKSAKPKKRATWRDEVGALAIVGVLVGLIFLIGIMPAVFLFTGGYFVLTRQYSWKASLLYTAILTASVYFLFSVA
ncbi:MAG TPA: tripartite tricarboxylate transporter TctB family protein, partial [Burkholderiales bacterium]|nr:tripartite tricarboxylate transporter TctB family protein [Burkholderiales bacterium]